MLTERILDMVGVPSTTVASQLDCPVEHVEDVRRRAHRTPRTGRHVLEQPIDDLRASDWDLAMRSNNNASF